MLTKIIINFLLSGLLPLTAGAAPSDEKFLIQTSETTPATWMNEEQVFSLLRQGKHFFDITLHQNSKTHQSLKKLESTVAIPKKLLYPGLVKSAQSNVDKVAMKSFLTNYSGIHNRYYSVQSGFDASAYLLKSINEAASGYKGKFTANYFNHTWLQPSVIARIEGTSNKEETVIIGAHLDSINLRDPKNGRAPGADDDGSGTTSVLEALRSLVKANFKPRRSVEFQFYAAEEVGLKGSQDIAQKYLKDKRNVVGMLQLDMTGYNEQKKIKLLTDYTDNELTDFVRLLIDNYGTYKWFNGRCGYACSDHASFNKAGFRSAQPGEDNLNQRLHTPQDTLEFVNFDHVGEFAKLGISFIVELAEPSSV